MKRRYKLAGQWAAGDADMIRTRGTEKHLSNYLYLFGHRFGLWLAGPNRAATPDTDCIELILLLTIPAHESPLLSVLHDRYRAAKTVSARRTYNVCIAT